MVSLAYIPVRRSPLYPLGLLPILLGLAVMPFAELCLPLGSLSLGGRLPSPMGWCIYPIDRPFSPFRTYNYL